jgi:methylmalonyl-CoA mutase N-terminal domain/subunit
VERALNDVRRAAGGRENTMPAILEAVRAYATLGELCDAFREVFGVHDEKSIL